MRKNMHWSASLVFLTAICFGQQPAAKKAVHSESDLPRFTYPVKGKVSDLLQSDPASFNAFAAKVRADLQGILDNYEIEDKSTKRNLLDAKLSLEELNGGDAEALQTIQTVRALEEKPDAKLTSDLIDEAIVHARIDAGAQSGPDYQQAFARRYTAAVNQLPWAVVQETIKQTKGAAETVTTSFASGLVNSDLQPMVEKSGTLDNQGAWELLFWRRVVTYYIPLQNEIVPALRSYIAAHAVAKPDIWAAREVTLTAADNPHPVPIGIWDAGSAWSLGKKLRAIPVLSEKARTWR